MAGDGSPVDIVINDKVDPKIAGDIRSIAAAARDADDAIVRLTGQLRSLDASNVNKLSNALAQNNKAYLDQEAALNRAVGAEQKAIKSYNDATTSQQRLQTEIARTTAAEFNAEAALNRAISTEEKATAAAAARSVSLVEQARAAELAKAAEADMAAVLARTTGLGAVPARLAGAPGSASGSAFAQEAKDLTALGAAQAAYVTSGERFISSLKTETETLGMSRAELAAYKAAQLGVTEEAAAYIAALKATEVAEVATGNGTRGLSGRIRELLVVIREIARGDFTRLGGSLALEAQYMGAFNAGSLATTLTLGGLAVALGTVVFAMGRGEAESRKITNSLEATNYAAGITSEQFTKIATIIQGRTNSSLGTINDVLLQLASSGKVSGSALERLAESAIRLSDMTGESATKIASDFLKMTDGVTKYAIEFASKYHSITAAQIDYIRQLEEAGQKEKAEQQLAKDVYDGIQKVAVQDLGFIEAAWRSVRITASGVWEYLKSIGRDQSANEKLDDINARLKSAQETLKGVQAEGQKPQKGLLDTIAALQKEHDTWQEIIDDQDLQARKRAENDAKQQAGIEASERLNSSYWDQYNKNLSEADIRINKLKEDIKNALAVNPNDVKALHDQANLATMILNIRKQLDPAGVKAAAEAQREADAINGVNRKLSDQIAELGLIGPAKARKAELDRIEEELLKRHINLEDVNNRGMVTEKQRVIDLINAKLSAQEVNKQEEALYQKIVGPMRDYAAALLAIKQLQAAKGGITGDQAQEQNLEALDKLLKSLHIDYGQVWTQEEKTEQVTAALGNIFQQTVGQTRSLAVQTAALNIAYQKGYINLNQYKLGIQQVAGAYHQLKVDLGSKDPFDATIAGLAKFTRSFKGMMPGLMNSWEDFLNELGDGTANVFGEVVKGQESLGQGFRDLAVNAVGDFVAALVKLGLQWLATQAIAALIGETSTGKSGVEAAGLAAAWAPAAIAASIATLGGADEAGLMAYLGALAAGELATTVTSGLGGLAGHKAGGYTGDAGESDIAGFVHGKEWVINAMGVRNTPREVLEAINAGFRFPQIIASMASKPSSASISRSLSSPANANSSFVPRIVIEDHGIQKTYNVASHTNEQIRIIANDAANNVVIKKVPALMATEVSNPNSKVSSALSRSTTAKRRRD